MRGVGKRPPKLSIREQQKPQKKLKKCVVRLRRIKLPEYLYSSSSSAPAAKITSLRAAAKPNSSMTRMVGRNISLETTATTRANSNRGPLKKRVIDVMPARAVAATPTSALKLKQAQKPAANTTPAYSENSTPITIAAGRSRRAIKPNPKYASEDVVTPKNVKNALLSSSSTPATTNNNRKQLQLDFDSSDDEYNKATNSYDDAQQQSDDDLDQKLSRMYKVVSKSAANDDSDLEIVTPLPTQKRRVGRPRIYKPPELAANSTTVNKTTASAAAGNSTPNMSLRNSGTLLINRKRKADEISDSDQDTTAVQVVKRSLISAGNKANAQLTTTTPSALTIRQVPAAVQQRKMPLRAVAAGGGSTTLNGSKISNQANNDSKLQNVSSTTTPKSMLSGNVVKSVAGAAINTPVSTALRNAQLKLQASSTTVRAVSAKNSSAATTVKRLASSPNKMAKNAATATINTNQANAADTADLFAADDIVDTSGTFTIVNIKDIISQKGDALISNRAKLLAAAQQNKDATNKTLSSSNTATATTADKTNRRKTMHSTILSDKPEPDREKNAQVGSAFLKQRKPVQKILNHTLAVNAAAAAGNVLQTANKRERERSPSPVLTPVLQHEKRPAPRILNSVVAKITQPVKPMIMNVLDSADEEELSSTLEHNKKSEMARVITNKALPVRKNNQVIEQQQQPSTSAKAALLANNNNSSKTTTTSPATTAASNENISITREGDKIVKRITCYETWYVVNIIEDEAPKLCRNQLVIPLIRLANALKDVTLPSANWTTRVMLHELTAATLAKTKLTPYLGDLSEHNISEENRAKYQPSSIMFRRMVSDRTRARLPYDRAVIFRNRTFFANIEGKNVKLVDAPTIISTIEEVSTFLSLVDMLTLDSAFVEPVSTAQ